MTLRLLILLALPLSAEIFELKNETLSASFDDQTLRLSLSHLGAEKPFAQASFGKDDIKKITTHHTSLTLHFAIDSLHLNLPPKSPFIQLQRHIHNTNPSQIHLARLGFPPLTLNIRNLKATKLKALGTGGLSGISQNKGSYTFQAIVDPATRTGIVSGWLTHQRGSGIFQTAVQRGKPILKPRCDYGKITIPKNQTLKSETLLIGSFPDARIGLERYADQIANKEKIKLRPLPKTDPSHITPFLTDLPHLTAKTLQGTPLPTPSGLSSLDLTKPQSLTHLKKISANTPSPHIQINQLWAGLATRHHRQGSHLQTDHIGETQLHKPTITHIQAYRNGLHLLRQSPTNPPFLLGSGASKNLRTLGASFGKIDAMRLTPELSSTLYFLHNRVWKNLPAPPDLARPIDLFDHHPPRIWHLEKSDHHLITLRNWDPEKEITLTQTLASLGLEKATYQAFENNESLGPITKELSLKIPPKSTRLITLRKTTQ